MTVPVAGKAADEQVRRSKPERPAHVSDTAGLRPRRAVPIGQPLIDIRAVQIDLVVAVAVGFVHDE